MSAWGHSRRGRASSRSGHVHCAPENGSKIRVLASCMTDLIQLASIRLWLRVNESAPWQASRQPSRLDADRGLVMVIRPRRSVLYVPGTNARALDKARALAVDAVILD